MTAFDGLLLQGGAWFARDYAGQRVAILATGEEASSILPEVLRTAIRVTLFEEQPTWVTPVGVPTRPLRRAASRLYLRIAVPDAWTRRQLTPHRRFDPQRVTVNPSYYAALRHPRTRLVHWPAYAIVERGIRTADGVEHQVDVVIVGATSRFAQQNPSRDAHQESA